MGASLVHAYAFMHMIFFSLFHVRVAYYSSSTKQPLCQNDESSALMQFKESFIINCSASFVNPYAYPKAESWKLNSNCCWWKGVECDASTGHVIGLDLSHSCLSGTINSSSSLFRLVHLRWLNLAYNDFNRSIIHPEIRSLSKLRYFNLSLSNFASQIPVEILELSKLESLDFSYNTLKLKNPSFSSVLENLTNLKELHLRGVDISSTIPHSLLNLSSLTSLSLVDCGLRGEFPIGIFHLPNLQILSLSHNPFLRGHFPEFNKSSLLDHLEVPNTSFSGNIPSSIENLNFLSSFDIWDCQFTGLVPSSLANLSQLTSLWLSLNAFNHWTMFSLDKLTNLAEVSLGDTNLYGEIPSSLKNLTQLTILELYVNHLTGPIPSWFGNLTKLRVLGFYNNLLSGTLNFDIFLNLKSLTWLQLNNNYLSVITHSEFNGTIPKFQVLGLRSCNLTEFPNFLRNQDKLEYLELSINKIQGEVPEWMWDVGKETLRVLDLRYNFLTSFYQQGALILPWKNLLVLYLDFNKLEGQLPLPTSSIAEYTISNNKLSGKLSPMICNLTSLFVVDLSNNNLSGMPLQCLSNFSNSLSILNLRNNFLHGTIPSTFTESCKLTMIDFGQNRIEGQLPRSLANCSMLETLVLEDNQITDTFPHWLGILPELRNLILRSNRFHGTIGKPQSRYDFSKLHIIDLSFNCFSGKLPYQLLKAWIAMKAVDANQLRYLGTNTSLITQGFTLNDRHGHSVTMSNKGTLTKYEEVPDFLAAIDLSSNRFEGEIPEGIGDLKALYQLNLSNNILTGHIPPMLGNITALESLDLSGNQLSGEIPQQLTQLTFLAFLNVSGNNLTGPIPQGKQFNTFENTSFDGNPGLCGKPLSKECTARHPPPVSTSEGSSSVFSFGWEIVAVGYACGFLIGSLIGHVATRKKDNWFFRFMGSRARNLRRRV